MPRTVRIEQPADALAQLHADPDARPGLLDGLLVEGADLFAARRRASRERISGPDPGPPPAPRKETSTMATATRPLLPPEAPSSAGLSAPASANGTTWRIIDAAEWAALRLTCGKRKERCPALLDVVATGRIISTQIPAGISRKGAIMSLHGAARGRGLRLEIRSCPNGELAVAAITPQDGQS
jgi:hypothetical protein